MKANITKRKLCVVVLLAALATVGCRQAPANPPEYYESELRAVRQEMRAASKVAKPLKDGYPWEGKKPARYCKCVSYCRCDSYCRPTRNYRSSRYYNTSIDCMPDRILRQECVYQREIDYLHQVVHGIKKTRLRLRD